MDKYTKTINQLKKEYINLKLSNTHNKFSNNKLINSGGMIMDSINSTIANLDSTSVYKQNFYYDDDNLKHLHKENGSVLVTNYMVFTSSDFI